MEWGELHHQLSPCLIHQPEPCAPAFSLPYRNPAIPIETPFIRCQDDAITSLEIGPFESSPCSVPNGQNPNCTPLFINLLDDAIDVRFLAVKQMPQPSFHLLALGSDGAAIRIPSKRRHRLLQPVEPSCCSFGFPGLLFQIQELQVSNCSISQLNAVCHVCGGSRQMLRELGGCVRAQHLPGLGGCLLPHRHEQRCRVTAGRPRRPVRWQPPYRSL